MSSSRIPPGRYYILSTSGWEPLAVTFNGLYAPMSVTRPRKQLSTQVWIVNNGAHGVQRISPQNGPGLYVVVGEDNALVASASPSGFVWSIKGSKDIYTIETRSGAPRAWDLREAKAGQVVTWQSTPEAKNPFWNFVPV